jgi:hypothetical protein
MQLNEIAGVHTARTVIAGQATAGTVDSWPLFAAPDDLEVAAVRWIPAAAVTGVNTNNFALAVQNKGVAGSGTTAVTATKTYASGTDSVANVAETLALSGTAANLLVAAGEVLALVRTVNASGLAQPDGVLEVDYRVR